ncbi:MAG: hypothetical protein ROO71_02815 [Balneola sp.]
MKFSFIVFLCMLFILTIGCNNDANQLDINDQLWPLNEGSEWVYEFNADGSTFVETIRVENSTEEEGYFEGTVRRDDSNSDFISIQRVINNSSGLTFEPYDLGFVESFSFPFPVESGFQFTNRSRDGGTLNFTVIRETIDVLGEANEVYTYILNTENNFYRFSFMPNIGLVREVEGERNGSEDEAYYTLRLISVNFD